MLSEKCKDDRRAEKAEIADGGRGCARAGGRRVLSLKPMRNDEYEPEHQASACEIACEETRIEGLPQRFAGDQPQHQGRKSEAEGECAEGFEVCGRALAAVTMASRTAIRLRFMAAAA